MGALFFTPCRGKLSIILTRSHRVAHRSQDRIRTCVPLEGPLPITNRLPFAPPNYVWYIRASWIDDIPIIKSTISYLLSPPNVGVPTRIKRHFIVFVVRRGLEPLYRELPVATTFHRNPTDLLSKLTMLRRR